MEPVRAAGGAAGPAGPRAAGHELAAVAPHGAAARDGGDGARPPAAHEPARLDDHARAAAGARPPDAAERAARAREHGAHRSHGARPRRAAGAR